MSNQPMHEVHDLDVQFTQAGKIEKWQFSCPQCAYQGEYVINLEDGDQQLDIFDRGDGTVIHFDLNLTLVLLENSANTPDGERSKELLVHDWGTWFTPEALGHIGEIVNSYS